TIAEWSEQTGKNRNAMYNRHVAGCTAEEIIFGKKHAEKSQPTIRGLRKSLGLTQREFAKKVGITRECIANYEAGRREPNADFYQKLSEVFGISNSKIGEIVREVAKQKRNVGTDH
uniref:helix-turn-helix domain-containing protein n=1 Tax=Phascolarctobacterium sp. TaxID=2049039 RepID=UPI0038669435